MHQIPYGVKIPTQGYQQQQQHNAFIQSTTQQVNYKSSDENIPGNYQHHGTSFQQQQNLQQYELSQQQGKLTNVAIPRRKVADKNNIPLTLEALIGMTNKENNHGSANQSKSPHIMRQNQNQNFQQLQQQSQQQQQHSQILPQQVSTVSSAASKSIVSKELKSSLQTSISNSLLKQMSFQQSSQQQHKNAINQTISNTRNTKFSISGIPQQTIRDGSSTSGTTTSEIQSEERNHSIHSKKPSQISMVSQTISANNNMKNKPHQVLPTRQQTNQSIPTSSSSFQQNQVSSAKTLSITAAPLLNTSSQQPRQAGQSANSKKDGTGTVKVFSVNIQTNHPANQVIHCSQPSSTGGSNTNSSRKGNELRQQQQLQQNYGQIVVSSVRRTESISQGGSANRNNLPQAQETQAIGQFQIGNSRDQNKNVSLGNGFALIPTRIEDEQKANLCNKQQNLQYQGQQQAEINSGIQINSNSFNNPVKLTRKSDIVRQIGNSMQVCEENVVQELHKYRGSAKNGSSKSSVSNNTNFFISPSIQQNNNSSTKPLHAVLQKKHSYESATLQPSSVLSDGLPQNQKNLRYGINQNANHLNQNSENCLSENNQIEKQEEIDIQNINNNQQNNVFAQKQLTKRVGISMSVIPDIQKISTQISKVDGNKCTGVDKNLLLDGNRLPQSSTQYSFNQLVVPSQSFLNACNFKSQPTPKDSQPQSAKGTKQIQQLVPQINQQENTLAPDYSQSKERANSMISQKQNFQQQQQPSSQIQVINTAAANPSQIIPSNGHLKSRLHVQKIQPFYNQGQSQPSTLPENQYYIGYFAGSGSVLPLPSSSIESINEKSQHQQDEQFNVGFGALQLETNKPKSNKNHNTLITNKPLGVAGKQNSLLGIIPSAKTHNLSHENEATFDSHREMNKPENHLKFKDPIESISSKEQYNNTNSNTPLSLFQNTSKAFADNLLHSKNLSLSAKAASSQQQKVELRLKPNLEKEEPSIQFEYSHNTNLSYAPNFSTLPYSNHLTNNKLQNENNSIVHLSSKNGNELLNNHYHTLQNYPITQMNQQKSQESQPQQGQNTKGSTKGSGNNSKINEIITTVQGNIITKEDQLFVNKSDRIFGGAGNNCSSAQGISKSDQNTLLNSQKPGFQSERLNYQLTQQITAAQANLKTGMVPSSSQIKIMPNIQGTSLQQASTIQSQNQPLSVKSRDDSDKSKYFYPLQIRNEDPILSSIQNNPLLQTQLSTQSKGSHLKVNPQFVHKPTISMPRTQLPTKQMNNYENVQQIQQQQLNINEGILNNSSSNSQLNGLHHLPNQISHNNHSNRNSNQKNQSTSLISPPNYSVSHTQKSSNSFAAPSGTLRNLQEESSLPLLNCNSSNTHQQHQNLLSTAIKSETTQFSNFSSDSPLVCTENISGIFTNRYEDNSQFKNYLSTKSNNNSANNVGIPGQNSRSHSASRPQGSNNPGIQSVSAYLVPEVTSFIQLKEQDQNKQSVSQQQIQSEQQCNTKEVHFSGDISHKKKLSNHLINKFGAICKVATEGSEQRSSLSCQFPAVIPGVNLVIQDEKNQNPLVHHNRESYSLCMLGSNNLMDPTQGFIVQQQNQQQTQTIQQKPSKTDAEILKQMDNLAKTEESSQSFASIYSVIVMDANELDQSRLNLESQIEQEKLKERKQQLLIEELACFEQEGFMAEQITYFEKCGASDQVEYLPNPDYFDNQKDITFMMRCILIDWMIEVCMELSMKRDTLYLAVNYVDRYLTINFDLNKSKLQLIGVVSLFMAAKVEEIFPPTIQDFAKSADDGYAIPEIVQTEIDMLQIFNWKLNPATHNLWMTVYTEMWDRFVKCSFDKPNKYQVKFVQDQKLTNKNFILMYRYPDQKSYILFRQISQLLDLMMLDINVLRFESRMLIASIMYLQLGIEYKQFARTQVHNSFNEKFLFANSLNAFNEFFNSFITQNFEFFLVDLLPSLQYVASFFDVEYHYALPPSANNHKDSATQDTYFPTGIEYIRKRCCS